MKPIKQFETKHNLEIDEKFHQLNLGNIGNVIYWMKFFEMSKNIPGNIVECGVGRARSLLIISALNFLLDKNEGGLRQIYGFDSFLGFPEPTPEDESFRNPKKGEWSKSPSGKYLYSIDFIKEVLSKADITIDEKYITLKKGFFKESLLSYPKEPIAILHIDVDLYQSHKIVLENLYDKVSIGGIIVFDDIMAQNEPQPFPGAKIAVKEFLGNDFNSLKVSVGGNYYYVKR